jgi:hypothetical protein
MSSSTEHWVIVEAKRWYADSARLVSKCSKPDYEGLFISMSWMRPDEKSPGEKG